MLQLIEGYKQIRKCMSPNRSLEVYVRKLGVWYVTECEVMIKGAYTTLHPDIIFQAV